MRRFPDVSDAAVNSREKLSNSVQRQTNAVLFTPKKNGTHCKKLSNSFQRQTNAVVSSWAKAKLHQILYNDKFLTERMLHQVLYNNKFLIRAMLQQIPDESDGKLLREAITWPFLPSNKFLIETAVNSGKFSPAMYTWMRQCNPTVNHWPKLHWILLGNKFLIETM